MKIVHTQKFVRMSPRKLRVVADVVRNLEANRAIEILPYTSKRAAVPLVKVIKTAVANAKDRKVKGELIIKEVQVNEGPRLKRGRAVSRGRWHPYMRRMSHIRVVLENIEPQAELPESSKEKSAKSESTKNKKATSQKAVAKTSEKKKGKK